MSVGPAALGNVLVQRLDAVLGTTMSAASANQVSGARPDAVSQPGNLDKPGSADGSNRDPRQGIQTGGARGDRPATVIDAKTAAALALAARGLVTSSDTTASAPTTLGTTARAILALLAQYPEAAPAVQGRAPLWTAPPSAQPPGAPAQQAGQPASQPGAPGQPTAAPAAGQAAAPAPAPTTAAALAAAAAASADPAAETPSTNRPARPAGSGEGATGARNAEATTHATLAPGAPSAKILGQALRAALQTSGLFYESHLTDLVFGRSNPSQLQQEPQARLTRSGVPTDADTARPRAESQAGGGRAGDANAAPGNTNAPAPGTPVSGIHQDLTLLVRQQLDVLANQALTWQGEAWPGTPMEWEVERDPYGGDPESAVSTWATRLKLDLPRLGLVDARLNLAGDQIVLQLVAPHSAAEINDSSDQLRSRLLAAGLTLSHLVVNVVDPRPVIPADI
ncbi:flagellar hook-length control protein FliK [Achromobacter xylosoxidans]|uniref:flagellar hook-length control protein FliK n=1 Tax=Alcaligenes xylosoxydans xylosoxydans TaxID=85698 RepID=UPI0005D8918D|nr:flagellar hook-length control protein FliK [Achromobacter xylosoxidans]QKQ57107.1 flagellar hook-length control protein FliK [Achromobacter xylosoxidans]QPR93739.1 flagellar hook-length control protein FliK [Achromobacter xylosoxidans]UON43416.1 flagellar hook-length control protein FliK [Achromobacter xylosoxidans]CKH31035.1 Flagellar hook-length control protein FliK [Achromobacter xylosoxidans]SQG72011.1 Flagellar hook-length control protein FliK [Achromobacter xylosoxidans]